MFTGRHQRLGAVVGEHHMVTVSRHIQAQKVPDVWVIIDDEHSGHGRRDGTTRA